MAKKKRNYRKEYDSYHGTSAQKKARASRNSARKKMAKSGKVRKGDGREVDHKNGNPRDNRRKNLRVVSRKVNRKKG
tara:strand:- start:8363 stop:8593 length:231 start_codon:yes stop_codon:yes gene_type:complete